MYLAPPLEETAVKLNQDIWCVGQVAQLSLTNPRDVLHDDKWQNFI